MSYFEKGHWHPPEGASGDHKAIYTNNFRLATRRIAPCRFIVHDCRLGDD